METQVICAIQQKGGAGKTTTLITIISNMVKDGAKIALIDTDDRRNLYRWASKEKTKVDYIELDDDEKLIPMVKKLKEGDYDAIFIDTAGYKSAMSFHASGASDLVLIPTPAEESSVMCALRTYKHIQAVESMVRRQISAYVLMMDVDKVTNITKAIRESLISQDVPLLDSMIGHATGFKEMHSTGLGPSAGAASRESIKLMSELQRRNLLWFYKEDGRWAS
ncbi:AAA family ATPase [Marinicella sp. W31]|uniref:AAA family ATPase n=1 Tax=Marinicella sp. W31 TaxID=3023713 RepID=UPI003756D30F